MSEFENKWYLMDVSIYNLNQNLEAPIIIYIYMYIPIIGCNAFN